MKHFISILFIVCPFLISLAQKPLSTPTRFTQMLKFSEAHAIYNGTKNIEEYYYDELEKEELKNVPFVVYSDRDGNPLFNEPRFGTENNTILSLGDKVFITKIQAQWLQVARKKGKKKYENIGWIHQKNILINGKSLLVDGINIQKRGLILFDTKAFSMLDKEERDRVSSDINAERFFKTPRMNIPNGLVAKEFEIRYVYKDIVEKNKKSTLLGKEPLFANSQSYDSNLLLGWIPQSKITPWDSRLCLEPVSESLNPLAYSSYTKKINDNNCGEIRKDSIYVFLSQEPYLRVYKDMQGDACKAKEYISNNYDDITYTTGLERKRWPGYKMRFPVLNTNGNDKEIAVVSTLNNSNDTIDREEVVDRVKKMQKKTKHMNILFVLDATSSMEPFRDNIVNAIDNVIDNLESDLALESLNKKDIQFALAVYRNKKDEGDPLHPRFEYVGLTQSADINTIKSKLNSLTFRSNARETYFEDHYYGFLRGLEKTFTKDVTGGESNMVILIGDCGAIESAAYNRDKIIKKFETDTISLMSYQCFIENKKEDGKNPWASFQRDILLYEKSIADRFYGVNGVGYEIISNGNESKVNNLISDDETVDPVFAARKYARRGKDLGEKELEDHISNTIISFMKNMEGRASELQKGEDKDWDKATVVEKNKMKSIWKSYGLSDEEISKLMELDFFNVRGHTTMSHGGVEYNAWEEIIFMEEIFKREVLDKQLRALINNSSSSARELRESLYSGLINLMRGFFGEDTELYIIENLKMNEVWDKVFGAKMNGWATIESKKIKHLQSSSMVSDDDFLDFYNSFVRSSQSFLSNEREFSKYKMSKDKTNYYWIPLNNLPGCGDRF